jgi:DNA-binding MarR family transcriptional regulator
MPKNVGVFEATGQTFTTIPNYFLDHIAPNLSASELRVMLYIYRHTLGYQKLADSLSYDQFLNGITSGDGRQIDEGTRISRGSLVGALASLEAKGLIERKHKKGAGKALTTTFQILFNGFPVPTSPAVKTTSPNQVYINSKLPEKLDAENKAAGEATGQPEAQNLDLEKSDFRVEQVQKTDLTKEVTQKNSETNRAAEGVKLILDKVPGISPGETKRLVDLAFSELHGRDINYIKRLVDYVSSSSAIHTPAAVLTALVKANQERTLKTRIETKTHGGLAGKQVKQHQRGPIDFAKYGPGGKYGHLFTSSPDAELYYSDAD